MTAKDRKVAEQIEGNRYVGIHIALAMDNKEKLPGSVEVFEGGPADRAGAKKDDRLEEIDGVATKGHDAARRRRTDCAVRRGPTSRSRSGNRRRRNPGR